MLVRVIRSPPYYLKVFSYSGSYKDRNPDQFDYLLGNSDPHILLQVTLIRSTRTMADAVRRSQLYRPGMELS